jgi:hypothetical protein
MLRLWLLISFLLCPVLHVAAQSGDSDSTSRPRRLPQLQFAEETVIVDQAARADGQRFTWRSGKNIPLPLTPGAVMRVAMDASLTTKKMDEGQSVARTLQLRAPIENPNQGKYADRDFLVEAVISGHGSGFKQRALLKIEPKQMLVEVRATDYIVIGTVNNHYILLKPGKWRLDFVCSLKQVVTPDGETWGLAGESEATGIKGNRFGTEQSSHGGGEDLLGGVNYFNPAGPIIYGVAQLRNLGKVLVHRPNITLPAGTDLYFRIENLRGTYLGPSTPKVPMEADEPE